MDCIRCGASNWKKSHDCPAMTRKCLNCGQTGHYANLFRSKQKTDRRIKHIQQDSGATSAEEDNWTPNKIYSINNTVHSTRQISKDGQPFFTVTILVNCRPIKFIIADHRSHSYQKTQWNYNDILTPTGIKRRRQQQNQI